VPLNAFESTIEETGEQRFCEIEIWRNKPRSKWPSPWNDVVTTTKMVVFSCSVVSIVKNGSQCSCQVELGVLTFAHVFKAISTGRQVQFLLDLVDLNEAFKERRWQQNHPEYPV
jgi:hypothetical protein